MMRKRARMLAFVLAAVVLFSFAFAASEKKYLALGDSITTGYVPGGSHSENAFPKLIAALGDYTQDNRAIDGQTTTELAAALQNGQYDSAIKDASLITITTGGNDMLHAMNAYLTEQTGYDIQGISQLAADYSNPANIQMLQKALVAIGSLADSAQVEDALAAYAVALDQSIAAIRAKNDKATVLVYNQYNPFAKMDGVFAPFAESAKNTLAKLNARTAERAKQGDFTPVDAATAFDTGTENLCYASTSPLVIDVHPNDAGHRVLADLAERILGIVVDEGDEQPIEAPTEQNPSETPEETPKPIQPLPFADVRENDWFYDDVRAAVELGIVKGVSQTEFAPQAAAQRAMVAEILYNMEGRPTTQANKTMTDVAAGEWYHASMSWASGQSILQGYADVYRPKDAVTRQELAAILYRYAQTKGKVQAEDTKLAFADADDIAVWAREPMAWASKSQILKGDQNGNANPNGQASRAELATMMVRLRAAI